MIVAGALPSGCVRSPLRLDALLAPLGSDATPGLAVMVLRRGAVVDTGAVGMADVARRIPIGPRTAFDIASDAKQFTAMLAMILHQEGRLDYDAPVVRFLPELSRFGDQMKVRHLLTHTSGLPDYYDALTRAAPAGGFVTNADALAWLARGGEPVFPPGDRFQYSDAGYEMLALVLERAAGKPFGELLRERILEPLGMKETRLRDRPDVAVPNRARGYTLRREGFVAEGESPLDCLVGSGALDTTLGDLARWDEALGAGRLVRKSTVDEALRPMILNDGSAIPYAFGWYLKEDAGHRRFEHPGAWGGYQAFILRYPDDRFTVVLLANRSDVNLPELADRIVAGAGLR
ncbi:MAG TPA: serine hydrolase domain-containing protein [Patescibacteria group bacterium]|nr:serine hydrolase domain-containing protein [Patescibacteria group bacterium]